MAPTHVFDVYIGQHAITCGIMCLPDAAGQEVDGKAIEAYMADMAAALQGFHRSGQPSASSAPEPHALMANPGGSLPGVAVGAALTPGVAPNPPAVNWDSNLQQYTAPPIPHTPGASSTSGTPSSISTSHPHTPSSVVHSPANDFTRASYFLDTTLVPSSPTSAAPHYAIEGLWDDRTGGTASVSDHNVVTVYIAYSDRRIKWSTLRSTAVSKIYSPCCRAFGLREGSFIFRFRGCGIGGSWTPSRLGMINGEELTVLLR